MEFSSSHEEESSILCSGQHLKKSRTDVTDAESNTINSGKFLICLYDYNWIAIFIIKIIKKNLYNDRLYILLN